MFTKTKKLLFALTMITMSLLLFASCSEEPAQMKITVPNGGFEEKSAANDDPNGWFATRVPGTADHVVFERNSEIAHSGSYSASIEIKDSHPEDIIAYNWMHAVEEFEIGKSYQLSGWVKTSNLKKTAFIVIQCWDKTKKEMLAFATTQYNYPLIGTTDWTLINTTFTVPDGTADVIIRAGMSSPENKGCKVWFDDIKVIPYQMKVTVPNGGFEEKSDSNNDPNGWFATRVPETADHVVFEWDSETAHSGSYSASIEIKDSHPEDIIAYNWTRAVKEFEIGKSYQLSGWVKTSNLKKSAFIVVQCWDKVKKEMLAFATTQQNYPLIDTMDWTLVNTTFTVPDGTADVIIRAGITSLENKGGKVWFDDIKVIPKSN